MEGGSPTLRRRRLGRALRSLREQAGLTGERAGVAIERSGSWISRVEAGRVGLRVRDLRDLLELYHVEDPKHREELEALAQESKQRGWWSRYTDFINESYAMYIGLEHEARALHNYEHAIVPGLLQTESYCRAIIRSFLSPTTPSNVIEARVELRMTRQNRVADREPELRFVIDEAVLHRPIGGQRVLKSQLERLTEAATSPGVDLRIVPFSHSNYVVAATSFVIMAFRRDPEIIYLETPMTGIYETEAEEYLKLFESITAAAMDPLASAALLRKMADRL